VTMVTFRLFQIISVMEIICANMDSHLIIRSLVQPWMWR